MHKTALFISITFMILVVGSLAVVWLWTRGTITTNVVPMALRQYLPSYLVPTVPVTQTLNSSAREEPIGETQDKLFSFQGYFVDKLYTVQNVVMGDFRIDGKTGAPVHVVFTLSTGNAYFGLRGGDITSFSLIPAAELLRRVKPTTHYELRLTVKPPQTEQEQQDLASLRQLIQDTELKDKEYNLIPQSIQELP